jgi:gamma-carbonic anhydrase
MDGCRIASDGMLAAGAMLTPGKVVASRQLWTGRPATYARDLTDEALEGMRAGVAGYVRNARFHSEALGAR